MTHHLASGIIVLKNDMVLLVKDQHGWSIPKGSIEEGELTKETALREGKEETGCNLPIGDVAFISEYKSSQYGQYLQVYYSATVNSSIIMKDPDDDIVETRFVKISDMRNYIKFRPWILPLENWLQEKEMKYYSFDLDIEGFDI